jgi:SAM-dependent methyltransferase
MIPYAKIDAELQAFVTNSGLHPDPVMSQLTIDAARHTVPRLLDVARILYPGRVRPIRNVEEYGDPTTFELGGILERHRSDKSTGHNYQHLYAHILGPRRRYPIFIFEVGLGSPNQDVVGNMGVGARAGASLYAWREFCPHARVYGADIDRRVLFSDDRIETFFVDQTDPASFDTLCDRMPSLDLIVDDGLHSTHTNLATLAFALKKLAPGGYLVIEDIRDSSLPIWQLAQAMIPPDQFDSEVVTAHWGNLFVVRRLP